MKNLQGLRFAKRLFVYQLVVALLIAGIVSMWSGWLGARSALLGGCVSIIPNMVFALKLFRHYGAHAAKQIVRGFYAGEALKLALSAVLFVTAFYFFTIIPLIFFITYILVQLVLWFASVLFAK